MNKKRLVTLCKLFPILIVFCLIGWIVFDKLFVMSGQYEINIIPGQANENILNFAVEENPRLIGGNFSVMSMDTNTLEIKVPKIKFSHADVSVKFRDLNKQPELFFGVLQDNEEYLEEGLKVSNPLLNNLNPTIWKKIQENDLLLWQPYLADNQSVKYGSINDFLNNLPENKEIITYNYNLKLSPQFTKINNNFENIADNLIKRGNYTFYIYYSIKSNSQLKFIIQDINTNTRKSGDFKVMISDIDDNIINAQIYKDEIKSSMPGTIEAEKNIDFQTADLANGIYKVTIETSDNVLTKQLSVNCGQLAYDGERLYINKQDSPIEIYMADGSFVNLKLMDKELKQSITIGNETFNLDGNKKENYFNYLQADLENPIKITIPNGGVIIETGGFFYSNFDARFLPYRHVKHLEDIAQNDDELNLYDIYGHNLYIIAQYNEPISKEDWLNTKINLDLQDVDASNGVMTFRFNAPNLKRDKKQIYLNAIELNLYTQDKSWNNIMYKLKELVYNFQKRIWKVLEK